MIRILDGKKAYRIDINSGLAKTYIKSIDWGYHLSDTRNKKLNRYYYEHVGKDEYFSLYNDSAPQTFSTLNHIAIIPNKMYLPLFILNEIDPNEENE